MNRRRIFVVLASAAALGLSACGTLNSVSVDVASQGNWPAGTKAGTYAFERLPSQQANAAEQARVESAAMPALSAAGFTQVPADQADYQVQVGARAFEVLRRDPFYYGGFNWRHDWWFYGYRRPFFYGPGFGYGYGYGYPYDTDTQREVAVLVRDRRSQQVVYETRAVYTNRWTSDQLLPALFEAAMKDFPAQAISPRTVVVTLPPK